ncbi:MAG: diguanylate cyclase [Nitrospirota bacterium]|nr:diguanylate cyclase [Nitrospirota bacterium]MDH5576276.1 diguanylate cyclase [Nitrospirota bacterium]
MKRLTPIFWISLGLVSLTLSILLMSDLAVNLIPDQAAQIITYRQKYSEALAVQYSLLAQSGDEQPIQQALDLLVERNTDIQSVALILESGETMALAGPHYDIWTQPPGTDSTPDHIQIPIYNGDLLWGTLQLRFRSLENDRWSNLLDTAWARFLALVMGSGFLGYFLFMKRTLRQLDPSSVVPMRVQAAFNVLVEGVVFLDHENHIVLANRAFSELVGVEPHNLIGSTLDRFGWVSPDRERSLITYPWETARQQQSLNLDVPLVWERKGETVRKFRVNCTPILGEHRQGRGILVSFNDVTELDATIQELEIAKSEFEKLALHDPLTGCFNRRALFEAFENQWEVVQRDGRNLVCIMADIDHFKSYNDRFGHAVGDQVIQVVAKVLSTTLRPLDIMGRYGGEEFCILLPGQTCAEGVLVAERLREQIECLASQSIRTTSGKKITMSFGVSAASLGASDPLELVDQADKALYVAKQGGRNQVGRWTSEGPVTSQVEPAALTGSRFS